MTESRKIFCRNCRCDLGEIRDARLRKDIVYYCGKCDNIVQVNSSTQKYSNPFGEVFGDMFGGGFKPK